MTKEQIINVVEDAKEELKFSMYPLAALQMFMYEASSKEGGFTGEIDPMVTWGISDAMLNVVNAFKKFESEIEDLSGQVKVGNKEG